MWPNWEMMGLVVTVCYYDQVHLHVTDYFKFPKPGDFMEIDPPALVR